MECLAKFRNNKKKFREINQRRHSWLFSSSPSELIVDVEARLAAWVAVVRDVSEGEEVGPEIVLEDNDLVFSLLEKRSGDVERLLRPRGVVTTHVKPVHKDCSVLPVLDTSSYSQSVSRHWPHLTGGTVVVEESVCVVRVSRRRILDVEDSSNEPGPWLPVVPRHVGLPGGVEAV